MLVPIALVVIVLAVFHPVIHHDFVRYDDNINIVSNPHVSGLTAENVRWMFTDTSFTRYMPLGWLSYAVDRHLFGLSPFSFHAGNLLFHTLNTLLLFFLLKQMVSRALSGQGQSQRVASCCAGLASLWWAINPLRVEPVSWASARIYNVAIFFALVWLWAWLRSRCAASERQKKLLAWLSLAAYGASLLTYPLALFALVALLALDVYPLRRAPLDWRGWFRRETWPLWQEKIPFVCVALIVLAATAFARSGGDPRFGTLSLADFGVIERAMQACYVVAYYVWKPWAPFDLAPIYPTLNAFNPLGWPFIASAGLLIGITCAAVVLRRRWPILLPLWITHLVMLVPFLGLSEYPHSAADRYAHLHSLIWAALIAAMLATVWGWQRVRTFSLGALTLTCALFAILAVKQLPVWRQPMSVYTSITSRFGEHPGRSRFDEVIGMLHLSAGRTNEAIHAFEHAIHYESKRTDRNRYFESVAARCERAMADICASRNDLAGVAAHLEGCLKVERQPAAVVGTALRLSSVLTQLGRMTDALPWLTKAAGILPNDPIIHRDLGNAYAASGDAAASEFHFAEARRLNEISLARRSDG